MKTVLLLMLGFVVIAFAQDPANILIYQDIYSGYGNASVIAAGNLWPSANIQAYDGYSGEQTAFNTALSNLGGGWDIVVVESWNAFANSLDWYAIQELYTTENIKLFVSSWQWNSGITHLDQLGNVMGVSSFTPLGAPVIPHYAWDVGNPICDGITDWGWADPGLGILNYKMTVSTASPVTGWTASPSSGEAGICVAEDGCSVISGFTPAYANEAVPIWQNILAFLWSTMDLQSSTWAGIKASF